MKISRLWQNIFALIFLFFSLFYYRIFSNEISEPAHAEKQGIAGGSAK